MQPLFVFMSYDSFMNQMQSTLHIIQGGQIRIHVSTALMNKGQRPLVLYLHYSCYDPLNQPFNLFCNIITNITVFRVDGVCIVLAVSGLNKSAG